MTVEQLEASRAERMRQNGHGAVTLEDVRTWIEETGLCIFLPRSAQAGFTAPTFVEAIAGQRTTEPTLELISTAESLLVRLEAEGVAVRLNLAGQPGDRPDYVVAGWVLPYIYALRGDRDWRRSPQLTGSRQVSQLAVEAARQIDTGNQTATQVRDALGREVTETAVFRALHELWKQLRIIPVVPEIGQPALWQPLRQRFQKAIAEGASTSQVTAISVLASIYLQAVVAASMEDVEMFLSPLTSRSKIREVVRGLAATRQVHSTQMGHSPMFYVAGTLPEFPVSPSFQSSTPFPPYRGSAYLGLDRDLHADDGVGEFIAPVKSLLNPTPSTYFAPSIAASIPPSIAAPAPEVVAAAAADPVVETAASQLASAAVPPTASEDAEPLLPEVALPLTARQKPLVDRALRAKRPVVASAPVVSNAAAKPSSTPRPRTPRTGNASRPAAAAPRERSRSAASGTDARANGNTARRAPAPRGTASNGNGSRSVSGARPGSGSRPASSRNGSASSPAKRESFSAPARTKANGAQHNQLNGAQLNGARHNGAKLSGTGVSQSKANGSNGNGHAKPASRNVEPKRAGLAARGNGHHGHGGPVQGNGHASARGNGHAPQNGTKKAATTASGFRANGSKAADAQDSRSGARDSRSAASNFKPKSNPAARSSARNTGTKTSGHGNNSAPAASRSASGRAASSRPVSSRAASSRSASARPAAASRTSSRAASGSAPRATSRPASRNEEREPAKASAAKRYSYSGQASKSVAKRTTGQTGKSKVAASGKARTVSAAKRNSAPAPASQSKRRG